MDWLLEEDSRRRCGCKLKTSPQEEIDISWVRTDTSEPEPWNMLKQEHGLIPHCPACGMCVSTTHTSLSPPGAEDTQGKVCVQETKQSFFTRYHLLAIEIF